MRVIQQTFHHLHFDPKKLYHISQLTRKSRAERTATTLMVEPQEGLSAREVVATGGHDKSVRENEGTHDGVWVWVKL